MVAGMSRCKSCGLIFSMEEQSSHVCKITNSLKIDRVEYIHCLFQELENLNIGLPMGDYMLVYDILEDIREDLELSELMWQTFFEDKEA